MKINVLIIIAIFLVSLPWIQGLDIEINNMVTIDGIPTSSIIVMTLTIIFSLISWSLFSWASKNISFSGFLLGIISGASLVLPFFQFLGPMAGVIVGIVAGFIAFMLQKKMLHSEKNSSLIIATVTLVMSYFVLFMIFLMTQTSLIWDTGDGIASWTGTAEGLEKSGSVLFYSIEFIFFPVVVVSLIITGLIIRGKKT